VALGYRSSRSEASEVVAELESLGGQAHAGRLDITDQQSVNAFVADVAQRYGRLDVLVNAAGRLEEADTVRFSELDTAAASALLEVDVIGAMRMCHAVRPIMLKGGGGVIVNFSSTAPHVSAGVSIERCRPSCVESCPAVNVQGREGSSWDGRSGSCS
jgi:NAD(P)-dependent dehydrogenase (short-subunit alcohol dehydrogenase family)